MLNLKRLTYTEQLPREADTRPYKWWHINTVYICSPYAGTRLRNLIRAMQFARWVASQDISPVVPHLYFPWFLDDSWDKVLIKQLNQQLIDVVDELWVLTGTISSGMKAEIEYATKIKKPIRYFSVKTFKDDTHANK
ncbi:MAG: hypothetical protein HXK31_04515 [Atopobium sp.]|nr:hypothetical protein [Atopobium sp.]